MESIEEEQHCIIDPDYYFDTQETPLKRQKVKHEIDKNVTIMKIKALITKEFDNEILIKENELEIIQDKIHLLQSQLDKLRACATIGYYSTANKTQNSEFNSPMDVHPSIRGLFEETSKNADNEVNNRLNVTDILKNQEKSIEKCDDKKVSPNPSSYDTRLRYRFHIIVGNVSKFIASDDREQSDRFIYKWMMYVRTPFGDLPVEKTISKVLFYLHPSYAPHQIVEVSEPPFHLTRRGWGEFPLRVQLFFHETRNKCVDIIHNLKLDKRQTRFQELGAETNVELFLFRSKPSGVIDKCNLPTVAPEKDESLDGISTEEVSQLIPERSEQEKFVTQKVEPNNTVDEILSSESIKSENLECENERKTNPSKFNSDEKPLPFETVPNINNNYVIIQKSPSVSKPKAAKIQRFIKCRNKDGKIMFLAMDKLSCLAKIKPTSTSQLDNPNSSLISKNFNLKNEVLHFGNNGINNESTFTNIAKPLSICQNSQISNGMNLKSLVSRSVNFLSIPNHIGTDSILPLNNENLTNSVVISNRNTSSHLVSVNGSSLKKVKIIHSDFSEVNGQYKSLLKPLGSSPSIEPRLCSARPNNNIPVKTVKDPKLVFKKINENTSSSLTQKITHITLLSKFTSMQDLIWYLARKHPIVDENADRCEKYYCCKDLKTFLSWSLTKRRAFEWQRAKAVNEVCKSLIKNKWNTTLEIRDLWSTKQIILFCRRHFFTPPYMVNINGKQNEEQKIFSDSELDAFALSAVHDVKSFVNNLNSKYPSCSTEEDKEIDVINLSKSCVETVKSIQETNVSDNKIEVTIPSSSQAEIVRFVASEIGVKIKPVEIYPEVQACIVEDMIFKVTKLFAEDLIRGAHATACDLDQKSFTDEISLRDVTASIISNSSFSFLSSSLAPNYPAAVSQSFS